MEVSVSGSIKEVTPELIKAWFGGLLTLVNNKIKITANVQARGKMVMLRDEITKAVTSFGEFDDVLLSEKSYQGFFDRFNELSTLDLGQEKKAVIQTKLPSSPAANVPAAKKNDSPNTKTEVPALAKKPDTSTTKVTQKTIFTITQSIEERINRSIEHGKLFLESISYNEFMIPFKNHGVTYELRFGKKAEVDGLVYLKSYSLNSEKPVNVNQDLKLADIAKMITQRHYAHVIKQAIDVKIKNIPMFPKAMTTIVEKAGQVWVNLDLDSESWKNISYIPNMDGRNIFSDSRNFVYDITPGISNDEISVLVADNVSKSISGAVTEHVAFNYATTMATDYGFIGSIKKTAKVQDKAGIDFIVLDSKGNEILLQVKCASKCSTEIMFNDSMKLLFLYMNPGTSMVDFSGYLTTGIVKYANTFKPKEKN